MSILRFSLLIFLALLGISATADERGAPKVSVVYLPDKNVEHVSVSSIAELKRDDSLPAGKYRAKVKATLVSEPVESVVNSRDLELHAYAQNIESAQRWLNRDKAWIWMPASKASSIAFPFEVGKLSNVQTLNLFDYNELRMDFADVIPGRACHATIEMTVAAKTKYVKNGESNIQRLRLVSVPTETAPPVLDTNPAEGNWQAKDNIYLAKRMLGMPPDEYWRYVQDKENVVIQRRFYQNLQNAEYVDLHFSPGVKVSRVNLQVIWDGYFQADDLLDWDAVPKQVERTANGTRVRMFLGGLLKQRAASLNRHGPAILTEVVIFVRGKSGKVAAQRPLRRFTIFGHSALGRPDKSENNVYVLHRRHVTGPNRSSLVIDLHQVLADRWSEISLENGIVTFHPDDPSQYCGVRPISLRLVSTGDSQRPALVGNVSRFSQELGGPFLSQPNTGSYVEWIESDSYLPFSLLPVLPGNIESGDHTRKFVEWGVGFRVRSTNSVRIEKASHRVSENKRNASLHDEFEEVTDDGYANTQTSEPDSVVLTGVGGEVHILWARSAKLHKDGYLLLRMPVGTEHISDASALIEFDSGEQVFAALVPNQAALLGSLKHAGKTIRHTTIRLKMKAEPFKLRLGSLLLFHPRLIQSDEVVSAARPDFEFTPLAPVKKKAPERAVVITREDRISGVMTTGNHTLGVLSWTTPVRNPVGALVALQLDYRLSAPADRACWVKVVVNGVRKSVTRTLCPGGTKGVHIESLAQVVNEFSPDELIHSISWEIQPTTNQHQLTSFDFQAYLGTAHAPSVVSFIEKNAVFSVNQKILRPQTLSSDVIKDLAQRGTTWLDMGTFEWLGGQPTLQLASSHSYIWFPQVRLETNAAPSGEQTAHLLRGDQYSNFPWPQWIAIVGLILLVIAWASLRLASLRCLLAREVMRMRAGWSRYRSFLTGCFGHARRDAFHLKIWANRAIGVCAFVLGLWLLSGTWNAQLTSGLMGFAVALMIGTLWHERRWRHSYGTRRHRLAVWLCGDSTTSVPLFVLLITILAAMWMAWGLVHGKGYEAMLLFAAVCYLLLPFLAVRWFKRGNVMMWLWIFVATVLYFLGFLYGAGRDGNNYYLAFGGLAAMAALRAWLVSIQNRVAVYWPSIGKRVYLSAGSVYFSCAFLCLVLMALFMMLKFYFLSEHAAMIAFYSLVTGVVLEVVALRQRFNNETGRNRKLATRNSAE